MLIEFTRKVPPYNAGERAGFPDVEAQRFIRLGAATSVEEAPSVPVDEFPDIPAPAPGGEYSTRDIPAAPANKRMGRKGR